MRARLFNTSSLSRDSPHPSHESAREYNTMVNTSCRQWLSRQNARRSTEPSEETTVRGPDRWPPRARGEDQPQFSLRNGFNLFWEPGCWCRRRTYRWSHRDQPPVGHLGHDRGDDVDAHGGPQLASSLRATAVQTPKTIMLKQHQMTFMMTVPGRSRIPDEKARNGDQQAQPD